MDFAGTSQDAEIRLLEVSVQVIAGQYAFVALKSAGSITCWGHSSYGGACVAIRSAWLCEVIAAR